MATKIQLDNTIIKLRQDNVDLTNKVSELEGKLCDKTSNLRLLKARQNSLEKDVNDKKAQVLQIKQTIMTVLATKYPEASQSMFDPTHYPSTAKVELNESEELKLLRYVLTLCN